MIGFKGKTGLKEIENRLKNSFKTVKNEFDEHREAINQNTNEIQYNYEFLTRLDMKIEKLSERVDELSLMMRSILPGTGLQDVGQNTNAPVSELTSREKEVFFVIYASETGATGKDISLCCSIDESLVHSYLNNLLAKGVPVLKRFDGKAQRFYLEESFRERQAKENIIGISQTVVESVRI